MQWTQVALGRSRAGLPADAEQEEGRAGVAAENPVGLVSCWWLVLMLLPFFLYIWDRVHLCVRKHFTLIICYRFWVRISKKVFFTLILLGHFFGMVQPPFLAISTNRGAFVMVVLLRRVMRGVSDKFPKNVFSPALILCLLTFSQCQVRWYVDIIWVLALPPGRIVGFPF